MSKAKSLTRSEENIGHYLHDLGVRKDFLKKTQTVFAIQAEKFNDYIKVKKTYSSRNNE